MARERQKGPRVPEIPDRLFFRIGEVTEITGVQQHVLRFWETEFATLSPQKGPSGQRRYRRKDIETVLAIKCLLYDEGYTIAGARKALRSRGAVAARQPAARAASASNEAARQALAEIRGELKAILALLPR